MAVAQAPPVGPAGAATAADELAAAKSPWRLVLETFLENKLARVGIVVIVLLFLFSWIGPLLYHTNQSAGNLLVTNLGPRNADILGTDNNGFDVLGRLMVGGQSSLEVGLAVGIVATAVGLVYGAISGYFGGVLDNVMMRVVDVGLAIPVVFLFIFMSQIFKPNLTLLIVLLVVISWLVPGRLVRGEALTLRTREYVEAVRGMGGRSWRIIAKHLIPNTIGVIVVTVTFQVANAVLILALLQYLGFGLPPTVPTWGSMITDGTSFLSDGYWWEVYPALFFIVVTIVAFNVVGDAMQDAFDVRLQEK